MIFILSNHKLKMNAPRISLNKFSTTSQDYPDYVEYTGASADGRIYTPEEWTSFNETFQYITAKEFCHKYWRFDLDRDFDIKDFDQVYFDRVQPIHHNYTIGSKCPQIDKSFTPQECKEFYDSVDREHYLLKCFDLGKSDQASIKHPLDDWGAGAEFLEELFDVTFFNNFSFTLTDLYEFWFILHRPLLAEEYYQIGLFLGFAVFLSILIVTASYMLVIQKPESEKLSTYECGFEPYEDAKNKFDVQFYIVAILFVLFDIEIVVMLPWCLSISNLNLLGYWSMIEFLLELGLGFIYVWCVGALDW